MTEDMTEDIEDMEYIEDSKYIEDTVDTQELEFKDCLIFRRNLKIKTIYNETLKTYDIWGKYDITSNKWFKMYTNRDRITYKEKHFLKNDESSKWYYPNGQQRQLLKRKIFEFQIFKNQKVTRSSKSNVKNFKMEGHEGALANTEASLDTLSKWRFLTPLPFPI